MLFSNIEFTNRFFLNDVNIQNHNEKIWYQSSRFILTFESFDSIQIMHITFPDVTEETAIRNNFETKLCNKIE